MLKIPHKTGVKQQDTQIKLFDTTEIHAKAAVYFAIS